MITQLDVQVLHAIIKRSKGTLINVVCVNYKCLYIVAIKTENGAIQI